jgi:hypothetical protein
MTLPRLLAAALLALSLAACSSSLTRYDSNPWLEARAGSSDYDISGKWESGASWSGSWGEANFIQDGARFYGQIGSYNVDGAVNGPYLYMALTAGKRVYYTASLKREADGSYAGKVVQDAIVDGPRADNNSYQVMILRRKNVATTSPVPRPGATGPARAL